MRITAKVKSPGARENVLRPVPYEIPDGTDTLRKLLLAVCEAEVARYNAKEPEQPTVPFLTAQELDAQAKEGKVSFGAVYSDKKADLKKAQENVLQSFSGGLVRVVMDATPLAELDAPLHIEENAGFTFIRLTFLAGGF